jgi:hypothetical protein
MHKTHWLALLSNGETAEEFKGDYKEIKDKPSPWQRLVKYCNEKDLAIVGLQIKCEDRTWTLPAGANEYYYRRYVSKVLNDKDEEHLIFISAVFDGFEVQIWVDEYDPNIMFNKVING